MRAKNGDLIKVAKDFQEIEVAKMPGEIEFEDIPDDFLIDKKFKEFAEKVLEMQHLFESIVRLICLLKKSDSSKKS